MHSSTNSTRKASPLDVPLLGAIASRSNPASALGLLEMAGVGALSVDARGIVQRRNRAQCSIANGILDRFLVGTAVQHLVVPDAEFSFALAIGEIFSKRRTIAWANVGVTNWRNQVIDCAATIISFFDAKWLVITLEPIQKEIKK